MWLPDKIPIAVTGFRRSICVSLVRQGSAASGHTCADFCNVPNAEIESTFKANVVASGRRVTVSSLVSRALQDQARLLLTRKADLERWNEADQAHFARWFGTTSEAARETIYKRVRVLTRINREYAVANFRFARDVEQGVFAFVHPNDPGKIFVAAQFVYAPFVGTNSRAGTVCQEMSHFAVAGGTRDFAYQPPACKRLARSAPNMALYNADNFEFWIEHAE